MIELGLQKGASNDNAGQSVAGCGDVNGDAVVDAADKRQLARWLAGNAEAVNRRADMDEAKVRKYLTV